MAVPTAASIKTILEASTYPENTLSSENIFDYKQFVRRRRYPSCEIEVVQPEGSLEDKRQTLKVYAFEIRYYVKLLGIRSDEVATTDAVETAIIDALEAATLQDHKITFESKTWTSQDVQADGNHPAYTVATLRVSVRQIIRSTAVADGFLIFDVSESSVDNPPGADVTYNKVFDVDISEGYRTIQEYISTNPDGNNLPVIYSGGFSGTFIGNIPVKDQDIGTTGEKLNKLATLQANGKKPLIGFIYNDKDNQEVPDTITDMIKIAIDRIQRLYRYNDMVVYRIIGTVIKPSTITTT